MTKTRHYQSVGHISRSIEWRVNSWPKVSCPCLNCGQFNGIWNWSSGALCIKEAEGLFFLLDRLHRWGEQLKLCCLVSLYGGVNRIYSWRQSVSSAYRWPTCDAHSIRRWAINLGPCIYLILSYSLFRLLSVSLQVSWSSNEMRQKGPIIGHLSLELSLEISFGNFSRSNQSNSFDGTLET